MVTPNPLTAIFGVVKGGNALSHIHRKAIAFASLLARRLILFNWKGKNPPTYIHWIRDVMMVLNLEKIRYSIHGTEDKYNKAWSAFTNHVKSLTLI